MALTATPKRMAQGICGAAMVSIYTTINKEIVKEITICNRTSTKHTFNMAIVPQAVILGDEHYIFNEVELDAYETKIFQISMVIEINDKIYASADIASTLTYYVSGVEFTAIV